MYVHETIDTENNGVSNRYVYVYIYDAPGWMFRYDIFVCKLTLG